MTRSEATFYARQLARQRLFTQPRLGWAFGDVVTERRGFTRLGEHVPWVGWDDRRDCSDAAGETPFAPLEPLEPRQLFSASPWIDVPAELTFTGSSAQFAAPSPVTHGPEDFALASARASSQIGLDVLRASETLGGIDGSGFSVVVLDTGIDLDHNYFGPDSDGNGVADRIVFSYDFADNDANAADIHGHGTHVSSIIGSQSAQYPGVAPGADIIHLKVFSDSGSGSFASIERALQWTIANAQTYNIAAVNLSLGDSANHSIARSLYGIGDELAALASRDVMVVAAAGNDFVNFNSQPGMAYPAADPNVLAVGAVWSGDFGQVQWDGGGVDYTTGVDRLVSFSQRDAGLVDVVAPGAIITAANRSGGLAAMAGTSMAAPFVAGAAALAQQAAMEVLDRRLTLDEFRSLIDTTSERVFDGDDEHDNVVNTQSSFNRLDVHALIQTIFEIDPGDPEPLPAPDPEPAPVPAPDAPDLRVAVSTDLAVSQLVPGERLMTSITVANLGTLDANGPASIELFLSTDDTLDDHDTSLGSVTLQSLRLPSQWQRTYRLRVTLPNTLTPDAYQVIARIDGADAQLDEEAAGQTAASDESVDVVWRFGSWEDRRRVALTVHDVNGDPIMFRVGGDGYGVVTMTQAGLVVDVHNTAANSALVMTTVRGQDAQIAELSVYGDIAAVIGRSVDLVGNVTIEGDVRQLMFDDVLSPSTLTIAGSATPVVMRFDQVADLSIDSAAPIRFLLATQWLDTDQVADSISAPSIGVLLVRGDRRLNLAGDFNADVNLTGDDVSRFALAAARRINGAVTGQWSIAGDVGVVFVDSFIDVSLDVTGSVRLLRATGDFTGELNVASIGVVYVMGDLQATIEADDVDTRGQSIGLIRANTVTDTNMSAAGGISRIVVGRWQGGHIEATTLGTLLVTGDRRNYIAGDFAGDLSLEGDPDRPFTLGTAMIRGTVSDGVWSIAGPMRTLAANAMADTWRVEGSGVLALARIGRDVWRNIPLIDLLLDAA